MGAHRERHVRRHQGGSARGAGCVRQRVGDPRRLGARARRPRPGHQRRPVRSLATTRTGVPSQLPPQRQLVRFATGHHFVAVTAALPDSLVSLLVLAFMPGAANAYYYSACGGQLLPPALGSQHVQRPHRRGRAGGDSGSVAGPAGEPPGARRGDSARRGRGVGMCRTDHASVRPAVHAGREPAAAVRGGADPLHDRQFRHRSGTHPGACRPSAPDRRRLHPRHHRARSVADPECRPLRSRLGLAGRPARRCR